MEDSPNKRYPIWTLNRAKFLVLVNPIICMYASSKEARTRVPDGLLKSNANKLTRPLHLHFGRLSLTRRSSGSPRSVIVPAQLPCSKYTAIGHGGPSKKSSGKTPKHNCRLKGFNLWNVGLRRFRLRSFQHSGQCFDSTPASLMEVGLGGLCSSFVSLGVSC